MGDRCYSEVTCNKRHVYYFIDMGYREENGSGYQGEEVHLVDEEANYANYDDLNELGGKGIPFHGSHTEGSCYGAFCFASVGLGCSWVSCDRDTNLMVRFSESDRAPVESDIEEACNYLDILEKAIKFCREDIYALAVIGDPLPRELDIVKPRTSKKKVKDAVHEMPIRCP